MSQCNSEVKVRVVNVIETVKPITQSKTQTTLKTNVHTKAHFSFILLLHLNYQQ